MVDFILRINRCIEVANIKNFHPWLNITWILVGIEVEGDFPAKSSMPIEKHRKA
jgi:hypothetical protein